MTDPESSARVTGAALKDVEGQQHLVHRAAKVGSASDEEVAEQPNSTSFAWLSAKWRFRAKIVLQGAIFILMTM